MVSLVARSPAPMDPELQRLLCEGATTDGECLVWPFGPKPRRVFGRTLINGEARLRKTNRIVHPASQ